jgi:hypothetical protein
MTNKNNPEDDAEPVVQAHYSNDESASEAVIRVLAAAEGVEPTELDLLYDFVDPEALDSLLNKSVTSDGQPTVIEFGVLDYRVVVSSDGQITVLEFEGQ